jgi:hypothetical protein
LSNGGSSSLTAALADGPDAVERIHRLLRCARSRGATPDSTDQLCAIESMRHSSPVAEPSGVPSSK